MARTSLTPALLLLVFAMIPPLAWSQGCVATGSSGLMLGGAEHSSAVMSELPKESVSGSEAAQGPYLRPGGWQATMGYRWFMSHVHYVGAKEQSQREDAGTQVVNHNTLLDFSLTRGLTERLSLTAGLPFFEATRWNSISKNGAVIGRDTTQMQSFGDARLVADAWLWKPRTHAEGNVSLGAGLKFPTGNFNQTGTFHSNTGAASVKTLDQSIQAGDGRLGLIVEGQAFRVVARGLMLFANGTYLVTPYATNGVNTFRSNAAETQMSVADQYLALMGFGYAILPRWGLSGTMAARLEGIPPRDLIGSSVGFRRPGLIASVEPGLVFNYERYTLTFSAPVALHRERQRSVPDEQTGGFGDAAFADYSILIGQSVRF